MPKMQPDESTPLIVREDERPKPKLPKKQLAILVICRLSEPICLTSILSYLPQMIRSFGVEETDVGFWVGITASSFSVAQCMTGVAWGRLSDRVGRKPAILCGILGMLSSVLVFGFSNSIAMAMISRSCIGFLNGNVGILRTVVAELVPERELQPQAFSLLPLTWSIGSIAGPIIGGFLSEPAKNYPAIFPPGGFFDRHPFALPNMFTAAILFMALVFGTLFLEETLVGHRHRYDPGREVGKKIEEFLSSILVRFTSAGQVSKHSPVHVPTDEETAPLASHSNNYSSPTKSSSPESHHTHHPHAPLPWSQVLTRQSIYNILVYFLIAIHVVSYDSILPVFFSTQPTTAKDPIRLPFHIPGGFGLTTAQIGLIYSVNAIVTMLLQFLLYPPIARHYGSVKLLAVSAAVYPFIYFVTPYTLPITSKTWLYASWSIIILLKSITGVFAFTSSTILITNTASSIRVLGTLNGFATSTAAMGRAAGPSLFGWLFSVGQKGVWTTIPWIGLAIVAATMWIWIPKLVEGGGVGGESSSDSSDSDDEEEGGEEVVPEVIDGERIRCIEFAEPERGDDERIRDELEDECKKFKGRRRRLSMGSVGEQ
ncbi:hypothetical protein TWF481_001845 [Arthrobotrys musiformis]|uniref:Major facilitator superfamily (MFS) profile domain-containing protein n=1 Tax=Arthrobotrys musiformis TaxID=47236 RepID=A0AAV9VUG9_9PEZI